MSSVFGGTRIYTFLSDGSVVASQTRSEGGGDVCDHPELTRTALGVLRVASGPPEPRLEVPSRQKSPPSTLNFDGRVSTENPMKIQPKIFSPVEIHEGMARYPGISILVVGEVRLFCLASPSGPLASSQVRATKSVDAPSYPAHRRACHAPPTAPADVISTCHSKFLSRVW